MGKNVAVFVDVANIFYAAKAAGVDIDYVTLLKAASAGRDLVRAYAYTGLDPDNENQRNFHDFLRRSNYKVVSKDIRKYGDGKVKANLDIELVVDMMKTARNLDIAIVVSGDGDFAPAIRAVQEQGVRVEVISFRGNTSSDLIEVADLFTDIVQLARVEKGTRSGRRVADDDADLSMTEVPDKQTEGTGAGRGRGRGRGRGPRGRAGRRDRPTVAAATRSGRGRAGRRDGRGRRRRPGRPAGRAAVARRRAADRGRPGRAPRSSPSTISTTRRPMPPTRPPVSGDARGRRGAAPAPPPWRSWSWSRPRPWRGRGGRGCRGRRRRAAPAPAVARAASAGRSRTTRTRTTSTSRRRRAAPRATPFGSVWDSQLGTPGRPRPAPRAPLADDEDFDEPEIPEYLIAEQRRGSATAAAAAAAGAVPAAAGPPTSRRWSASATAAAVAAGAASTAIPDVSGRPRPSTPPAVTTGTTAGAIVRPRSAPAAGRSSNEPWSDVPPELEAHAPGAGRPEAGPEPAGRSATRRRRLAAPDVSGRGADARPRPRAKPRATRKPAASTARRPRRRPSRARRRKPATPAKPTATSQAGRGEGRRRRPTDAPAATAAAEAARDPASRRRPRRRDRGRPRPTAATADALAAHRSARTTRKTAPTDPA